MGAQSSIIDGANWSFSLHITSLFSAFFFRLAYSFLHSALGDKVKAKSGARKKSIRYCFVSRMKNRNNIHNLDTDGVLFAVF
jgi:hypothetical protein